MPEIEVNGRKIGASHPPLVIAEIGINHEGSFDKAVRMVDDALAAGCECVKFQYHVVEDEMIPNDVVPGNATESIWDIMVRCALSREEERRLKDYVEQRGLIYLSTPFSRAAANELETLGVAWYKIGSGECNNYPLIRHVAGFGKPVVISTGMNDLNSIGHSVEILRAAGVPFGLLHCTSMYPTPYDKVRLGAIAELAAAFPDAVLGLSDHSLGPYTCFGAVALGASIVEKHFTSSFDWPGPDIPISVDPLQLSELVKGSRAIHAALGGNKQILPEEQPTIDFAYACVVTTRSVSAGEVFSADNIWVKRPGTGEIKALDYETVLGRAAVRNLPANAQVSWGDTEVADAGK
ncbi:polyhydroxyalkanoate biosynthesis repressor PhaR [Hyphomicrobium sp. xq]|uniref:Polyhydroxyalkanoate biosynthesis repressor PhaR n=1 Tax=Hyphomicrobium album TaxID=2665159 RepID=A0A6I3KGA8_9HYPH|nr:N-acetylneuraminate synthase family protein [Hyphomicrobium album]MTD94665.1 polyhydroxyalkanoate biosynthesis repressor PhaR [Hyphomicrobium album]